MPLAGSQPSPTAKERIKMMASQKVGTEMPAKAKRLEIVSTQPPGLSAEATPRTRASVRLSARLSPASFTVCPSAGTITSIAGWLCTRL